MSRTLPFARPPERRPNAGAVLLYNTGLAALSPVVVGLALFKLARRGGAGHWRERLGLVPRLTGDGPRVWLQAVSMGETVAATSVARLLRERWPDVDLLFTTTTETGQAQARRSLISAKTAYFPLDFRACGATALARARPHAFVSTEELWPNLLDLARRRDVATVLVNGKVSDRTFARARAVPALTSWVLGNVNALMMQSERDAERVLALGASPGRVQVAGNLKFDQPPLTLAPAERATLRAELGLTPDRPVLVAGSVHLGEVDVLLDAFVTLRQAHPKLALIVAPRHLEKADIWERASAVRGLALRRRSAGPGVESAPVVLLDTMGELARVYGAGDVALVGGTFVPVGGHDVLQPMAHGLPVIVGPRTHQQRDTVGLGVASGAVLQVTTAEALTTGLAGWLSDPTASRIAGEKGRRLLSQHRGAAERCERAIAELVEARL